MNMEIMRCQDFYTAYLMDCFPSFRRSTLRWASKGMCHFVRSHVSPSVPARVPAVAPVSARRVVPAVALAVRAAAARVLCFRLASGGPVVASAFVPVLPPQASACPGGRGFAFSFGRPLSLGRAAGVTLVRRVSSSARRGCRIASADFHSTGVACSVGGIASRGHCAAAAPALAHILGALCVQPSRPNPPVNLAPFGRWTLRDKAAQRRLPAR